MSSAAGATEAGRGRVSVRRGGCAARLGAARVASSVVFAALGLALACGGESAPATRDVRTDAGDDRGGAAGVDAALDAGGSDGSATGDAASADADGSGTDVDAGVGDAADARTEADHDGSGVDVAEDGSAADADAPEATGDAADDATEDADADAGAEVSPDVAPSLDTLLDALRADLDGAMLQQANAGGWPAPVDGGWLFVSTDRALSLLAGDFNDWAPAAMNDGGTFWWLVVSPAPGDGYKLTDRTRWVADPWSRGYRWDSFGEMSVARGTGRRLERWFRIGDDRVRPRNLRVLVPAEPITHVLYAHDGQNLYGTPDAILGGWHVEDSAPAGMLVVGIENTPDRYEEYGPSPDLREGITRGGRAGDYADFVRDTVRPLIRATYGEPGPVGVMGSSMGGVISLYIALVQPGEWRFAASLSGAFNWGSRNLANPTIIDLYRDAGHGSTPIYLDAGGGGSACSDGDGDGVNDDDPTEQDGYCTTLQMRDLLVTNGYTFNVDLWHWYEPGAAHNEPAWAARVSRPLGLFAAMR